jgi:hypothetical protein
LFEAGAIAKSPDKTLSLALTLQSRTRTIPTRASVPYHAQFGELHLGILIV